MIRWINIGKEKILEKTGIMLKQTVQKNLFYHKYLPHFLSYIKNYYMLQH